MAQRILSNLRSHRSVQDLTSTPADITVTLNGISHIVTPDLARDLSPELIAMLTHSRAHIRKRAILALYKVLVKYPEASQNGMGRLREKLEDSDAGMRNKTNSPLCVILKLYQASWRPP